MKVNYDLGAASFESIYAMRQRIQGNSPRPTITEYTANQQMRSPGSKVFGTGRDVPPDQSATQLREGHNAQTANRKAIREAMNRSIDDVPRHIRQYAEAMDERGNRGQVLLARA
ncbi:hypothetical protein DBZ36_08830 [Alginatibacterium sediminis]|uniref:Uncharacterized protein n=1 Tax=Alginatibacterium sediminis TaxID=2164068 RepID=A0A420ECW0_9ALTE|nr:hypothetical protein [Alginatibacterium sediminis]RKF18503.1 hypothetical protein DBZ36_08830 [Alginatibacterium sediminis]